MGTYQFKNWNIHVNDSYPESDWQAKIKEVKHPNIPELINHHAEEALRALKADSWDHRWDALQEAINLAGEAWESGNPHEIGISMYRLGEAANQLNHPNSEEMCKLYEAALANIERTRPIVLKNARVQSLSLCAQNLASLYWQSDSNEEIRIGEMCEKVYPLVHKFAIDNGFQDLMPGEVEGIKKWLRTVAPAYAQKRGRPAK